MQSTRKNKAIQRKEPGYRPSMIRFEPKGVSIQTKNAPPTNQTLNSEPR